MRWGIAVGIVLSWLGVCHGAYAEWEQLFRSVSDTKIHSFQADSVTSGRFLIGIEGGVMESRDGGMTWKRTLTVPANQAVQILYQEPGLPRWWALTTRAVYRSVDGGRKWEPAAQFMRDSSSQLHAFFIQDDVLYAGLSTGLVESRDAGSTWLDVPEFRGRAIYQIERSQNGQLWVASSDGVFRRSANHAWECVYKRLRIEHESPELEDENENLENDVNPDGVSDQPVFFWFNSEGQIMIADGTKKVQLDPDAGTERLSGSLPTPIIIAPKSVGEHRERAVLATARGIALWEDSGDLIRELSAGWPGSAARSLVYEPAGDQLIAVTPHGVFQYEHPDLNGYLEARLNDGALRSKALLEHFDAEPRIIELQEAAMRYAEVHPEKIIAWRRAAARRAWLPSLSFGHDAGSDQTVDIDRGGTGDADRFIQGPDEQDQQWSVDVSWDLADLIWSDDQTSIDNRSKLMVQLRDDLLTQLNHLYYSRRRLQIEALLESGAGIQKAMDRQLQIDEYTAGIDALTGGWFSKKLGSSVSLQTRPDFI